MTIQRSAQHIKNNLVVCGGGAGRSEICLLTSKLSIHILAMPDSNYIRQSLLVIDGIDTR